MTVGCDEEAAYHQLAKAGHTNITIRVTITMSVSVLRLFQYELLKIDKINNFLTKGRNVQVLLFVSAVVCTRIFRLQQLQKTTNNYTVKKKKVLLANWKRQFIIFTEVHPPICPIGNFLIPRSETEVVFSIFCTCGEDLEGKLGGCGDILENVPSQLLPLNRIKFEKSNLF